MRTNEDHHGQLGGLGAHPPLTGWQIKINENKCRQSWTTWGIWGPILLMTNGSNNNPSVNSITEEGLVHQ